MVAISGILIRQSTLDVYTKHNNPTRARPRVRYVAGTPRLKAASTKRLQHLPEDFLCVERAPFLVLVVVHAASKS